MTASPQRYPLAWPKGRKRNPSPRRGTFTAADKRITVLQALSRLEDELDKLGAVNRVFSSNYETRMDGSPVLSRGAPADPGVCVYFQLDGKAVSLPCDTYTEVAQNIAGIAQHLKATRNIESYGVATGAEMLQAFMALPPPAAIATPVARPWREVFGFSPDFPAGNVEDGVDLVEVRYKRYVKEAHAAGSEGRLTELNAARDLAKRELEA